MTVVTLRSGYASCAHLPARALLCGEGITIDRKRVTTTIRQMGIEATYRRPHTSKPADKHEVYPYLLRGMTVGRLSQVWAMDITYIPMARGFDYPTAGGGLVQQIAAGVDFDGDGVVDAKPDRHDCPYGGAERGRRPPGNCPQRLRPTRVRRALAHRGGGLKMCQAGGEEQLLDLHEPPCTRGRDLGIFRKYLALV
jgi:hypothetical protein